MRGANDRATVPEPFTEPLNLPDDGDIVDVFAIPSKQIIHCMNSGQGNMRGIQGGLRRDQPGSEDLTGKLSGGLRFSQQRNTRKQIQACCRRMCIASLRFCEHEPGNKEFIILPAYFPPFLRGFLIGGKPQVPAAAGDQIAWDGGSTYIRGLMLEFSVQNPAVSRRGRRHRQRDREAVSRRLKG